MCYFLPLQSLLVSLPLPLVSTLVFSCKELLLPRPALCALSRLRCKGDSLLSNFYLSRIGRIENPSYSACGHPTQDTSQLVLQCPAADPAPLAIWRLFVFLRPLIQALGCCLASGAPWSSVMLLFLGRGRVIG